MSDEIKIESREQAQKDAAPTLEVFCGVDISSNPKKWSLGDVMFLLQEMGKEGTEGAAALTPDMMNHVRERGYSWIDKYKGAPFYAEAFLRMDAYARLNEIQSQMNSGRED